MRDGNRFAACLQIFKMQLNGFCNEFECFSLGFRSGNASWEVRHIGADTCSALLKDDGVSHVEIPHSVRPACLRAFFSVPGGMSTLGFPATVTVPGLVGW